MLNKILQDNVNEIANILKREKILPEESGFDEDEDNLMAQALMHSSALETNKGEGFPKKSNETLEWYGDKVIGVLLRAAILKFLPSHEIGRFKSVDLNNPAGTLYNTLKSNAYLSKVAERLKLDKCLFVADKTVVTESMKANVVEAIIGALMHSRCPISWGMLITIFFPEIPKKINEYSTSLEISEDDEYLSKTLLAALQSKGPKAKTHRDNAEREVQYSYSTVWPVDVNRVVDDSTLLLEAVCERHNTVARQLLKKDADVLQTHQLISQFHNEESERTWNEFLTSHSANARYNNFLKNESRSRFLVIDFDESIRAAIRNLSNNREIDQIHLFTLGVEVYKLLVADILFSACNEESSESELQTLLGKFFSINEIELLGSEMEVVDNLEINKGLPANTPKVNAVLIILGALFISHKWLVVKKTNYGITVYSNPDSDKNRFDYIKALVKKTLKPRLLTEIENWRKEKKRETETAQMQRAPLLPPQSNNNPVPSSTNSQVDSAGKKAEQPAISLYFQAAVARQLSDCQKWIQQAKKLSASEVDAYSQAGATPLIQAIKAGKEGNALALLAAGANPKLSHKKNQKTPLQYAEEKGLNQLINKLKSNAPPITSAAATKPS